MKNNFWGGRRVFVTGANGFLGSWLTEKLVEKKAKVVALIRDQLPESTFNTSGIIHKVTIINGRLEDYEVIERVLNEYEIDTCFHLGAQTLVEIAERSPLSTFESNIKGTWNVLEAVRKMDTMKRLVLASSDKAYGSSDKLPYSEDDYLYGLHPYDVSKTCSDLIAQAYYNTYGLPVVITRCGNIYGGGDLNFSRIIPGTIKAVISNENPVLRSDGTYLRDYIYVKDVVDAYMTLTENLERKNVRGQAFNIGTETPISVLELVDKILTLSGKEFLKTVIKNEAEHEIKKQYLDCQKIRQILGWKYKYYLDMGLKETISWYNKFLKGNLKVV
jgi:CDP-glucose 4,6-dehydratase